MHITRSGAEVSPRVVVLLGILVERMDQRTGVAWPGYRTLMSDTGWSEDAVRDAIREAKRLGAIEVRTFHGRGLAAEFRFTAAVYGAPNLDVLATLDRQKRLPAGHLFEPGKGGSDDPEKVAHSRGKGGSPATPSVSPSVGSTERPSYPPAVAGGTAGTGGGADHQDEQLTRHLRKAEQREERELAARAIDYVKAKGELALRPIRRRINDWARGGATLDEMREAIDRGEHRPKAPL